VVGIISFGIISPHLGTDQVGEVGVVSTLVTLQDEFVNALNHFLEGSVGCVDTYLD